MGVLTVLAYIFVAIIVMGLIGALFSPNQPQNVSPKNGQNANLYGKNQQQLENEIIERYEKSVTFQRKVELLAEEKFRKFKEDFLAQQGKQDGSEIGFSQAPKMEKVEKPDYDYSEVQFYEEEKPTISKDELLEVIDKRDVKKIDRKFLFPKKEVEDTSSEFYKKKVVITGDFSHFRTRNEIAEILYNLGADIDTSVTEKTSYLIKGENCGWSKEAKAIDFGVIIYTEQEFLQKIKTMPK